MKFKKLLPALLFVMLIVLGCMHSKVLLSDKSDGGFPQFAAVNGTGVLESSRTDSFTFAVFGDCQGDQKSRQIISGILKEINDYQPKRPAFVFSLGDIIKGKDPQASTEVIKQKFTDFLEVAKIAGVPVFNTPGNHELDDAEDIPSERMHKIYLECVGPLYGAFDYGNSRFITLNTEDIPPKGTPHPPGDIEFSYISDAQFEQLDKDLGSNKDKTHIFIMMHYPMKPQRPQDILNPASLKKLTDIFAKYDNISYVLASHEHLYYNPQDPTNMKNIAPYQAGEPTRYLVSGGGGARMYIDAEKGGFHHYLVFEVDGENVSVKIHRVDS